MRAYREGTLEQYLMDTFCLVEGCAEPKRRYDSEYCAKHNRQLRKRGRIIIHEIYDQCLWCGKPSTVKFCSDSCSGKYWRSNPENRVRSISYSAARRARKKGAEGGHTNEEWLSLLETCGGKCLSCQKILPLTRDHVVPLSKGGTDYIDNIQPLCLACNLAKGVKTIDYRIA